MTKLHQIQIGFDALEDRLLMRLRTTEPAEFRFWLTRRYVLVLWQALNRLMQDNIHAYATITADQQGAMMAFQKDKAELQGDFRSPFKEDGALTPLGTKPILLSGVQVRTKTEHERALVLVPQKGQGIELVLDETLLFSLAKLLAEACSSAGWGLNLTHPRQFDRPAGSPTMN